MGPLTKLWLRSPAVFAKLVELTAFICLIIPASSLMSYLYVWSGPLEQFVSFYRENTEKFSLFGTQIQRWQIDLAIFFGFMFALINVLYIRKYKIFWVSYAARAFKSLGSDEDRPKEWEGPDFKPVSLAFSFAVVVLGLGVIGIQIWLSWESAGSMAEVELAISMGKGIGYWFSQMMSVPEFAALYDFRRFVPGAETNAPTVFLILVSGLAGFVFFVVSAFIDGAPKDKISRYTTYCVLGLAGLYFAPLLLWFLIGAIILIMFVVAGFLMLPAMAVGFIYLPMLLVMLLTSVVMEWRLLMTLTVVVCNLVIFDNWWDKGVALIANGIAS